MAYSQSERLCSISTPLGDDAVLLTRLVGEEAVSRPFGFTVDLLSEDPAIGMAAVIGKPASISLELAGGEARYFHGVMTRFVHAGSDPRFTAYRVELRPWLWLLTRRADCRIFQNMTVPEILQQVFERAGFRDFELRLSATYRPRVYCVQYRETDFNFVSRLMEDEGISYFFEHDVSSHKMVLFDRLNALAPCAHQAEAYMRGTGGGAQERDEISAWHAEQTLHTGRYALTDYNFEDPQNSLDVKVATAAQIGGNGEYETYDHHPNSYGNVGDGNTIATIRMEEEEAARVRILGEGDCRAFGAGYRFKLKEHFRPEYSDQQYALTAVTHHLEQSVGLVRGGSGSGATYRNTFACVQSDVPLRPPRVTPAPMITGPQTAKVVGLAGEEIYVDEYGRVKVQFHWDREGKSDENSSCWVRVTQAWAGSQWGAIAHPRIGDEVIVEFIEGNPDSPLITGCVYNATRMPPYELPASKTQTGIKTRSSKGGSPDNFNEIRFEDEKGKEELYFHAEKDQNVVVENDQSISVGRDRTLSVERHKSESVGKNKSIEVKGDHSESIDGSKTLSVKGDHSESIDGDVMISVKKSRTMSITKDLTESVDGEMAVSVSKDRSTDVGGSLTVSVAKDATLSVDGSNSEKIVKDHLLSAKTITLKADDKIVLQTGSAKIEMLKSGDITIKGKKITVKGSSDIVIKGSKVMVN